MITLVNRNQKRVAAGVLSDEHFAKMLNLDHDEWIVLGPGHSMPEGPGEKVPVGQKSGGGWILKEYDAAIRKVLFPKSKEAK